MFVIRDEFTDRQGKKYDIRNINYQTLDNEKNPFGIYITETKRESNVFFDNEFDEESGVYIFKSPIEEKKAFRIYKDFSSTKLCNIELHHSEVHLLSELIKRQNKIKYTEFPTGIITYNNFIIGQEIPYYHGYKTFDTKVEKLDKITIIKYYLEILKRLKELYENGIIYNDVHAKNFMVGKNDDIKIIDFEPYLVSFDQEYDKRMLENLKQMINRINQSKQLLFILQKEKSLYDIEETILTKSL